MIEAIFLDLDGPLLDGKSRHYRCYADILLAHGYLPMDIESYWEMKRNRQSRKALLAVSTAVEIYDAFLTEWVQNIERLKYLALDKVQPGAIEKLKSWKEAGIKVHLVTMRSNKDNLLEQLQETGLFQYLSSWLVCDHTKGGKGKAEAVFRAFPASKAKNTLWIGDTEADYEAARGLGCSVWLLTCGLRTKDFLKSLQPDFLSESIVDVKAQVLE